MIQTGRYTQALPHFMAMAREKPRDISVQYYLGLCALSAHDYALAELAFSKVVVSGPTSSPFVPLARKQLKAMGNNLEPQSCLQNDITHRWDQSAFPVKIFIADGRTLPSDLMGRVLTVGQYKEAVTIIQNSLGRQPVTRSYKPKYASAFISGVRAWDWAVREKLWRYKFVSDPRVADIVVLFCERCSLGERGYALYPWDWHQPEIIWIGCSNDYGVSEAEFERQLTVMSAHEIGHCLGLEHSNVESDLMFPVEDVSGDESRRSPETMASANDKASLRALYSMPADVNFLSVSH